MRIKLDNPGRTINVLAHNQEDVTRIAKEYFNDDSYYLIVSTEYKNNHFSTITKSVGHIVFALLRAMDSNEEVRLHNFDTFEESVEFLYNHF